MRQIISVSAILLCFCTPSLHAQTASPNSIGTQNIPYTPAAPIAPKDIRECMDFQNQIDAFKSAVGAQHQACLDSGKSTRPGGTGPGSQCSVPACQTLHDYLYGNAAAGMDQEAAACRAAVLRYQNRQTAERDSIQTMADAIATLAAPTVAAPIDSQGGLSDFDQQAQSQAVAGDNSGSNLAVSDDVQALAQGNALSDATPPDLSKYDPQVSDIDALAQAAAAKNVQLAANDPTLPQPPPPQSALSQKVDEIEGAIADARDSTIHDMKQGTLNFVNWVSNGFSSEPSPVSSNSDAPSLWQRLNDYSPPPANSTVDTAFKYGGDVITNDRVNNNAVAQQVEKRSLFQINGIFDRASQTMDQTSQALNGDGPPPDPIGPVVFDLRDMAPDLMQKLNAWDAFSVKVQSKWSDFKNWLKDDQSDKLFQTNP